MNEIPIGEIYRGIEIFGLQPPERVTEAKHQVDQVFRLKSPRALATFAVDVTRAPEARFFAKCKALSSLERHQRRSFDPDYLKAKTIGIERRTEQLARLIGHQAADWWPPAWIETNSK